MTLLLESLYLAWKDRDDFFAGGNMFVYYSELQSKRNDFRGPDVFVVLDTHKYPTRRSWVVWEEDGRVPDVVIEIISESTEAQDRGAKMDIYAKLLRVSEYYLFDPFDL
jgi:Uma2 family endonuclease